MTVSLFSDDENGSNPRTSENIPDNTWNGIVKYILQLLAKEYFGDSFSLFCQDNPVVNCGCDKKGFYSQLNAFIPSIKLPLDPNNKPDNFVILDLITFCHLYIAYPKSICTHSYFGHNHYEYDKLKGQEEFRNTINSIFARNGILFELDHDGKIIRLGSEAIRTSIVGRKFNTGDSILNDLLNLAREKYLNPNSTQRRDAIEKLWDAFERMKTLEDPTNKKASADLLISKTAKEPLFIQKITAEFNELTIIGNNFRIRHHETDKTEIESNEQVEYLFVRLYALIEYVLKTTGRM